MQEYTVIKKGHSIKPCINIPDEFEDIELEIKIRPLHSKHNVRSKLENLFNMNKDISPFEMIQNVEKWQQELRDEWEQCSYRQQRYHLSFEAGNTLSFLDQFDEHYISVLTYMQMGDSAEYMRKLRIKEGKSVESGKKFIEELIEWQKSNS